MNDILKDVLMGALMLILVAILFLLLLFPASMIIAKVDNVPSEMRNIIWEYSKNNNAESLLICEE